MTDAYIWGAMAIVSLVTAAIRFAPFLLLGGEKKTPRIIEKLGGTLPYAVMGMLVIYCLKGINFTALRGFLPELISSLAVGALYVWKRNSLLSIVAGTLLYMLLVQVVF